MKKVKEFTIVRKEWLHGEGEDASYLFRHSDNKKCCLGFYSLACGLKIKQINGYQTPYQLVRDKNISVPSWLIVKSNSPGPKNNSAICKELMEVNDDSTMPEKERESEIKKLFAKAGVKVKFRG